MWWTDGVLLIKHLKTKQNKKGSGIEGKQRMGVTETEVMGFF